VLRLHHTIVSVPAVQVKSTQQQQHSIQTPEPCVRNALTHSEEQQQWHMLYSHIAPANACTFSLNLTPCHSLKDHGVLLVHLRHRFLPARWQWRTQRHLSNLPDVGVLILLYAQVQAHLLYLQNDKQQQQQQVS
jgi:hypothetical protein